MDIKRYSECSDDEKLCLNNLAENYGLKVGNSFAGRGIKFTSLTGTWTNGDFDMYKVIEFCYTASLPCFIVKRDNWDFIIPMSEVTKSNGYIKPTPLFQVGDKVESSCKRLAYVQACEPENASSFINYYGGLNNTIKEVTWSNAIHSYCYRTDYHSNWFAEKALQKVAVPAEAIPECKFKVGEQYVLNRDQKDNPKLKKGTIITITNVRKRLGDEFNNDTKCVIEYNYGSFSDDSDMATKMLDKYTPPIEEKKDLEYWKQFIGRYVRVLEGTSYLAGIYQINDVGQTESNILYFRTEKPYVNPNVPGEANAQCVLLPKNYDPNNNAILPESFIDKVSPIEPIVKQIEVYFNKQVNNIDKEVILYKQEKEVNFNFPEQQKELIFF